MYRISTSKRRAAETEKETRMEEKEATSVEDMEEILITVGDRQPEPMEDIQQPEGQPEVKQPEKPTPTADANIF